MKKRVKKRAQPYPHHLQTLAFPSISIFLYFLKILIILYKLDIQHSIFSPFFHLKHMAFSHIYYKAFKESHLIPVNVLSSSTLSVIQVSLLDL